MRYFFHATPAILNAGEFLKAGKRGYVCLATNVVQAIYWAITLYGGSNEGSRPQGLGECRIYKVRVHGDEVVEDCVGHYKFEHAGKQCHAASVRDHVDDLDGEVVTTEPVEVVELLELGNLEQFRKLFQALTYCACVRVFDD